MVRVELSEEPVELLHCWRSHTLSSQDLVQEISSFNLVQHIALIQVVLAPDCVYLLFDEVFIIRGKFFNFVVFERINLNTLDLLGDLRFV